MTTPGHDELARQLRATPPTGLAALDETEAAALAALLREARHRQSVELQAASVQALDIVPRPLRGAVRKVVGL